MKRFFSQKIGTVELLVGLSLIELIVGSNGRWLGFLALAIAFHYAREHFEGDFTLAEVGGIIAGKKKGKLS